MTHPSVVENIVTDVVTPVLKVQELYKSNSDAIHSAVAALSSLGGAGKALDDWVPIVDKVVDGLDGLAKSTAFPFVGGMFLTYIFESSQSLKNSSLVAVFLFKGVIQLETQRRANSKRSRALILQVCCFFI